MTTETIKKAIALANSGQQIPVMELVRRNPEMAAVISKLHMATVKPVYDHEGNQQQLTPDLAHMRTAVSRAAQSIQDNHTVMQTLPDIQLASQILVSSIISPTDMNKTELHYHGPEGLIAPNVAASMVDIISDHFEQIYKIKTQLPLYLNTILFTAGSRPIAVIPENSIDEVINGRRRVSMESLSQSIDKDGEVINIRILGPAIRNKPTADRNPGIALEAFDDIAAGPPIKHHITLEGWMDEKPLETFITVVDNPDTLKIPQINQRIRENKIATAVKAGYALESMTNQVPEKIKKLTDQELANVLFKDPSFSFQPISSLKTQEQLSRKTVGNPLVLELPPESVIPVHVPGNVTEHIGYFVMLDMDGNPIVRHDSTDYFEQLSNRMSSGDSFASTMLNKVKTQMSGFNYVNRSHLEMSSRMYGEAIEQDLIARLRNGVYGNGVALAKNEEIYRIMMARALQKKHTQLLFLPVELVTYFAFKYSPDGMGVSLLEDMKIINSLRAMLQFSNVMAAVRNSIGRTEVKIKLDEDDPDPDKTLEIVMHEIQKTRHAAFPIGVSNPVDMVDWMGRAGFEFTHEGHPAMPDVRVDFGEKSTSYPKPDTELDDQLRKRSIMALGLSPENVDAGFNAEFATSIVNNNLLLAKRVAQIQELFCKPLSEHHRKIIMNSEGLLKKLRGVLIEHYAELRSQFKDNVEKLMTAPDGGEKIDEASIKHYVVGELLNQFVRGLTVTLPTPTTITLKNQLESLKDYTEALEAGLDATISSEFITSDMNGEIAAQIDTIKAMAKAYFIRKWMSDNGMLNELSELTTRDENGKPVLNLFEANKKHVEALTLAATATVVAMQTDKVAHDKVLNDATQASGGLEGGATPPTDDTTTTDDNGDGGDGGDATGDDPDFNLDLDDTGGGTTPEEAPLEGDETAPAAEKPEKDDTDEPAA